MWDTDWGRADDFFTFGHMLVETTSVSCVDMAVRIVQDSVNVARAWKNPEAAHSRTKFLENIEFNYYDEEVWRWDGLPE